MAIAVVQYNSAYDSSVVLSSNTTLGNFLIAGISSAAGTSTISDGKTLSWTGLDVVTCASATSVRIFWAKVTSASTSAAERTITAGTTSDQAVFVVEVSGLDDAPVDVQGEGNTPTGASTTWSTDQNFTTTEDVEFIFAIMADHMSSQGSATAGSGYTMPAELKQLGQCGFAEYQITSSAGSYAATATVADPEMSPAISVATFKEAGGAALTQEGFRFRNDDGDEDAATWLATQDTNLFTE